MEWKHGSVASSVYILLKYSSNWSAWCAIASRLTLCAKQYQRKTFSGGFNLLQLANRMLDLFLWEISKVGLYLTNLTNTLQICTHTHKAQAHAQTNLIVYFDRKLLWKGNFGYIFWFLRLLFLFCSLARSLWCCAVTCLFCRFFKTPTEPRGKPRKK